MRYLLIIIAYIFLSTFLFSQNVFTKGQLWGSIQISDDVPIEKSSLEYTIGYLPTFSLFKELNRNQFIDMEFSVRLQRMYSGNSILSNSEEFHRYWIRYSTEKLEVRLGKQKIIFGPSQLLRSLSWFDTFDIIDPTGQTDGIEALRVKWFPSNSFSLWHWAIRSKQDTLSYGTRAEISIDQGEFGLTYHHAPFKDQRVAIDYRYDGVIGFWNESAIIKSDIYETTMITTGVDYTLPVSNGILILLESMYVSTIGDATKDFQNYTAFMASMPLGILHQIMFIAHMDWKQKHNYNYLRWSSTYDRYSVNCMLSLNPKMENYDMPLKDSSQTIINFGAGLQIMFIYNY